MLKIFGSSQIRGVKLEKMFLGPPLAGCANFL